MSVFEKILISNRWLATRMSDEINISKVTITKLKLTWIANIETKFKIFSYLLNNNFIRLGQYTLEDFFKKI